MRRMRERSDHAHQLYPWQIWSYRFFRDQWRFAVHCMEKPISIMLKFYLTFQCSRRIYTAQRCRKTSNKMGRSSESIFLHYFPNRASEYWSHILVEHVGLEDAFVDFSMSRSVIAYLLHHQPERSLIGLSR